MTERVLSPRELNRSLLARQLLLERSSLSVPRALEAVGGLQTQYASLPPAKVAPVVDRLRLRRFRDQGGRTLHDLLRAPLPDASARAPVRFLQTFEALLMIHARRTEVMPEQYRRLIFNTKTPQSMPVFLIDGVVAGTWKQEGGRILLAPFEPVPPWRGESWMTRQKPWRPSTRTRASSIVEHVQLNP